MGPVPGMPAQEPAVSWIAIALGVLVTLGLVYYLAGRGQASADSRSGLMLGLRGLVAKELRSRSRGWRPMWLLTGYLGALTLGVAGFLALVARAGGTIPPTMGTQLFSSLALGAVLLLAFITPALTVGAISGERERRTLELLLVTRASALGLVGGKLLGSLIYILFLLAASLPAFSLVYLFGGVPPRYLAMVLAVAAVTAVAHAALGLLLSALLRRTIVASVVAYLLVLAVVLGLPFVSAATSVASQMYRSAPPQSVGPPPVYLYASPMVSLASVMPAGPPGSGMSLIGDLVRVFVGGGREGFTVQQPGIPVTHSVHVVAMDPVTGQPKLVVTWAPWVYHFIFSGVLTLLCLFGAALALAPVKPWRRWRLQS